MDTNDKSDPEFHKQQAADREFELLNLAFTQMCAVYVLHQGMKDCTAEGFQAFMIENIERSLNEPETLQTLGFLYEMDGSEDG